MSTTVYSLAIQATYQNLSIALFRQDVCIGHVAHIHQRASSFLIPHVTALLSEHGLSLADMRYLAVDCGPGAFTSLRVAIATVNGIAFASRIPLVPVDSFQAIAHEAGSPRVLVLFNAFNSDLYAAYLQDGVIKKAGCVKYEALADFLAEHATNEAVTLVGNGVEAYPEALTHALEIFPNLERSNVAVPDAQSVGACGYAAWLAGKTVEKVEPYYLKTQNFAIRAPLIKH